MTAKMTPAQWQAVDAILQRALERDPADRAEFVAEACGDDAYVRREVESLLANNTRSELLEQPAPEMDVGARLSAALAGRYVVEREIGRGGMATVYLAKDSKHGREVAIKVLHREFAAALGAERFLREIALMARLHHPHILPLHDSGEVSGLLYYVMPFVDGETLRTRLERERQLSVDDALQITREVAAALDHAHRLGVVHRDIKPENILLQDGNALLADFGIALAAADADSARMTGTGLSLGTPQYMAPEQALGERNLDARVDVYALGAVMYEMLVGEPPFTGSSGPAVIARRLAETAPSLRAVRRSVAPAVEMAVARALERVPADRFATVSEFAHALDGQGVSQHRRLSRNSRRTAALLGIFALIALVAVVSRTVGAGWLRARAATGATNDPRGTRDSMAYALFTRATAQANRRGAENTARSVALYHQAIARDSNFADAWAGLAQALFFANLWHYPLGNVGVPADSVVPQTVRASERALELDSSRASPWLARGVTLRMIDPMSRRAMLEAVRRSLRIDSTSAEAWYWLGSGLADSLELRASIDAYRRAIALDPRHINALSFLGFDYEWIRNFDSALVWADSAVSVDASSIVARQALGIVRLVRKDWTDAEAHFGAVVARGSSSDRVHGWAGLADLAWRRGDKRAADTLLAHGVAIADTLHPSLHDAAYLAWGLAATGQRERALRLLERYEPRFDAHFQLHLQGDPMLDPLRSDPRFLALLRRGPVFSRP